MKIKIAASQEITCADDAIAAVRVWLHLTATSKELPPNLVLKKGHVNKYVDGWYLENPVVETISGDVVLLDNEE